MINEFVYDDNKIETRGEVIGKSFSVKVGEKTFRIDELSDGKYKAESDGVSKIIACVVSKGKAFLDIEGLQFELNIPSEDSSVAGGGDASGEKEKTIAEEGRSGWDAADEREAKETMERAEKDAKQSESDTSIPWANSSD